MSLKRRVSRLERRLGPPPAVPDPEHVRRLRQVGRRFFCLVEAAAELMSPEDAARVEAAFQTFADQGTGPYSRWVEDLYDGRWRLPEITPEVMKVLLLARLSADVHTFDWVCLDCGLCGLPRRLCASPASEVPAAPEGRSACLHCGAAPGHGMWAMRILDLHYPWMDQEGYVKPQP
jgi:hypothetical protein